jgi:Cdc6-like AAA superfamily ATPase
VISSLLVSHLIRRVKYKANSRLVEKDVHAMYHGVKDAARTQKQEEINRWLSPSDPSTNYNKALKQRQEGTGLWLLQSSPFKRWQTKQNSFLWLHGIPGCGKTILSSTIIEHLERTCLDQSLLYFYFDFNDSSKQTFENAIQSLISQLYYKRKDTQQLLNSVFSSHEDGRRQPSCELLCKVFSQMTDQAKEVYVVLDALDECPVRNGLLLWIETLLQLGQRDVHLLVTSRPEHDIELVLSKLAHQKEDIVPIQNDLVSNDIRKYIQTRVRTGDGLKRWKSRPDVLDKIETQLIEKANGM